MQKKDPQIKTVRHKKNEYDLKVTFGQESDGTKQKLQINLKINSTPAISYYRLVLNDQNIPNELISAFVGLDIAFDCFADEQGFEVNLQRGEILIKGVFQMRNRKIEKKYNFILQKYEVSEYEQMLDQVQQLQHVVSTLRQSRQTLQAKFKQQYQQKLDQQTRKFLQVISKKDEQIKNFQLKQQQLQRYISSLSNKISDLLKKIENFSNSNAEQLNKLKIKGQKTQKQLENSKEKFQQLIIQKMGKQGRKQIKRSHNQNQDNLNQSKQNMVSDQNKKRQQLTSYNSNNDKKMMEIYKVVNENSPNIDKFKVQQKYITFLGKGLNAELLMKIPIPRKQKFNFQFRIVTCKQGAISIGVIDQYNCLNKLYSSKRSISYQGKSGYVSGAEKKMEGDGFKQGDTVSVIVDLNKPYIQWKVNDIKAASCQPQFFQNLSRVFVPFIQMSTNGDCVAWDNKH